MFGEMAINVFIDLSYALIHIDHHGGLTRCGNRHQTKKSQCSFFHLVNSFLQRIHNDNFFHHVTHFYLINHIQTINYFTKHSMVTI